MWASDESPRPIPSDMRPRDSCCSVWNADASTAGSRVTGFVTPVPNRIRLVAATQKLSSTSASAARHCVSVTSRPSQPVASQSLATSAVRPAIGHVSIQNSVIAGPRYHLGVAAAAIDYRSTGIAVRGDIVASQIRAWQSLAAPGTWWTGPERVAIAREVRAARRCAWCGERKAALSPYAVNVTHDAATDLPPVVVDAVHRVVTDPGRLARRWSDEVIAAGVSDA